MSETLLTILFITVAWLMTFAIMLPGLIRDFNKYPPDSEERAIMMGYESPIAFACTIFFVVLLFSFLTMIPLALIICIIGAVLNI